MDQGSKLPASKIHHISASESNKVKRKQTNKQKKKKKTQVKAHIHYLELGHTLLKVEPFSVMMRKLGNKFQHKY